ncbi:MAG: glycosyltransferase family 4 protein [Acidisphaera sp.]|nr:glycosyltransferase family 4 protein [Acidisphaera sp.]
MKIALTVDRFDPLGGGLEKWTFGLASHLAEAGHEIHVVTFATADHALPLTVHVLTAARSPLLRARRIEDHLARIAPDVVHDIGAAWSADVFQPQTGSLLLSLDREIASFPLRRRLRAALSPRMILRRSRMDRLERGQARRARRIIAVSRLVRELLAGRHGVAPDAMPVIPNGVDTDAFSPVPRQIGPAVHFLASAQNFWLKGADTALRALALLAGAGHDVRLAIAGATPAPRWPRLAAELGIAGRVRFCGRVADMKPLFAAADVFLHPTRWDACSLSTLEAMASGLPVITTCRDGASELIEHGRSGFVLADPDDVHALAAHMRALRDADLRRRLGEAARQAALRHQLKHNYRAVEAVLVEAARGAPPAG